MGSRCEAARGAAPLLWRSASPCLGSGLMADPEADLKVGLRPHAAVWDNYGERNWMKGYLSVDLTTATGEPRRNGARHLFENPQRAVMTEVRLQALRVMSDSSSSV